MISSFKVGDTITTDEGIEVTIKDVVFIPMGKHVEISIYYHHEPTGKDGSMNLANLEWWFQEKEWSLK